MEPRKPVSREDAERMIREGDPFTPQGAAQISEAVERLGQDPNGSAATPRRYFHGGAPGLRPGDLLVPFDAARHAMSAGRERGGVDMSHRRTDRVFITTVPLIAWAYAASHQQGWVYEVAPLDEVEPDADWIGELPGVSFQTARARVVSGRRIPDEVRDEIRSVYADRATDSGWVNCSDGQVRWGPHGAAGVLFRHPPSGRFYLHRRSATVDHPGTWALPGGALHEGEDPLHAALREAAEEIGGLPEHEITDVAPFAVAPEWTYTVVRADVATKFFAQQDCGEADADGWFSPEQVQRLGLHPDFARLQLPEFGAPTSPEPSVFRQFSREVLGGK